MKKPIPAKRVPLNGSDPSFKRVILVSYNQEIVFLKCKWLPCFKEK